jgi:vacuolar-type H+-ATPase subunit E/Vma4
VSLLLRVFKAILETNLEAKRITDEATAQAEKIKKEAEQKSSEVYEAAYNSILSKAEKEAVELKRKATRDTDLELEKIRSQSEKLAEEIEEQAKKNFEKAVDCVLKEVFRER